MLLSGRKIQVLVTDSLNVLISSEKKDMAKKYSKTLRCLGVAVPPAVPVVAAVPATPALAANDRKFYPLIVSINYYVNVLI